MHVWNRTSQDTVQGKAPTGVQGVIKKKGGGKGEASKFREDKNESKITKCQGGGPGGRTAAHKSKKKRKKQKKKGRGRF